MPGTPIKKYRGFDDDYNGLPDKARDALNTFLREVSLDPDDRNLLEISGRNKNGDFAYPLGEGWVVYWAVKREKARFISIRTPKPILVEIYGFHFFAEFKWM
jgi:hypothetical protein